VWKIIQAASYHIFSPTAETFFGGEFITAIVLQGKISGLHNIQAMAVCHKYCPIIVEQQL